MAQKDSGFLASEVQEVLSREALVWGLSRWTQGLPQDEIDFPQAAVYVLTTQCCVESLRGLRQMALTVPILFVMYIYFLIHWWGLAQK